MDNAGHNTLLRLREADIVRLCGFSAANEGISLVAGGAVQGGAQSGGRLTALVTAPAPVHVTVELGAEPLPAAMRWTCAAHHGAGGGALGCMHVAAVLTSWVRTPQAFPGETSTIHHTHAEPALLSLAQPARQPELIRSPGRRRKPASAHLSDTLDALSPKATIAMAERVTGESLGKHEARARLVEALSSIEALTALQARLPTDARVLCSYLQLLGGRVTSNDWEALGQRLGLERLHVWRCMAALARHGLAFPIGRTAARAHEQGARPPMGWRIPPEVLAASALTLPAEPLEAPPPGSVPLITEGGRVQRLRPVPSAQPALIHALALVARAPRPLGLPPEDDDFAPSGSKHAGDSDLIPGDLAAPVVEKLASFAGLPVGVLSLARRLLVWARHQPEGVLLSTVADQTSAQRMTTLQMAFALWAAMPIALEVSAIDMISMGCQVSFDLNAPAFSAVSIGEEILAGRQLVLRLLRAADGDRWYLLDDLLRVVWRLDPFFLRGRQRLRARPIWWLRQGARILAPEVWEQWLAGDGTILRALICGPLASWGIVELGQGGREPLAFRVTSFGREALDSLTSEPPGLAPDSPMETLPRRYPSPSPTKTGGGSQSNHGSELTDREARAPNFGEIQHNISAPCLATRKGLAVHPMAPGALHDAIECWAKPAEVAGGRIVYVADAERILTALDQGLRPDALRFALRRADPLRSERAGSRLLSTVDQLSQRFGRSRLVSGWALLDAQDEPSLVEAVAAVPGLRDRVRLLSPNSALVAQQDVATLRASLRRRGLISVGEESE